MFWCLNYEGKFLLTCFETSNINSNYYSTIQFIFVFKMFIIFLYVKNLRYLLQALLEHGLCLVFVEDQRG